MSKQFDSIMQITPRPDTMFERGEGSWLFDSEGNKYLDCVQGWAVNTLGHCAPPIVEALTEQAGKLINASPAFYNGPMVDCANLLTKNSVFDQVFFANSGGEANEGAIKLARKWGKVNKSGAYKFITFNGGFHGRTLTTMAASGKAAFEPMFEPKTPGFTKVAYNDLAATELAIDDETVAIMLEPIQGEAGVIPADLEFVQGLRDLADKHNLLLIVDEVQTGIGRTGTLFAYEGYGIEPDIMTLGKGVGGGVRISALLAKKDVCVFEPGEQGGTYNGNPLMTAVSIAVLETVLESDFLATVNARSEYITMHLMNLSEQFGMGNVRGKGSLLALDTDDLDAATIVAKCLEKRVLINAPQPHAIRLMPALNLSNGEIDQLMETLSEVLTEMTAE